MTHPPLTPKSQSLATDPAHLTLAGRIAALTARFADPRLGLRLSADEVEAAARSGVQAARDTGVSSGDTVALTEAAERAIRLAIPARHLGLLYRMAKQSQGRGLAYDDRVQEGYFGLRRAAELFDVPLDESGPPVRFSTYAGYWIRQAIARARLDQSGPVRVPLYMHLLVRQVGRQQVKVSDLPHRMRQCLRQAQRARGPGGEGQYVAPPEDDTRELAETVKALLDTLEPTARTVITAHYGLDGQPPQTLAAIGQELGRHRGLTRQRVSQIALEARAAMREQLVEAWELDGQDVLR
jgi:RNA polymerase primary sigma factor